MREDTFLVSLMLVNNELGTVNDIPAIGPVRDRDALFHVDAAQGAGKVAIDLAQWPVDLMSFRRTNSTGPKASVRCMSGRARSSVQAQIHGVATRAACAPAPWPPTRLPPWARHSRWRRVSMKKSLDRGAA
jgi:cysteine sulfinate desulfinase/cysteine desulfurase-like protein